MLLLALDLSGVNSANIHLKIKDCGEVQIANIKFGSQFSVDQKLHIELQNMDKFTMRKQTVTEETTVSVAFA